MHNYFYDTFPKHHALLNCSQPNRIERDIMQDSSVVFFGGPDWSNVADDLSKIPYDDRPRFVLSLFMVVLADQCLYTYQRDAYSVWRRMTNYPKFGWSGFGSHNENPLKILWAPEREEAMSARSTIDMMSSFVDFFLTETNKFFTENLPNVNLSDYFNAMRQDAEYAFDEGEIVRCFKNELDSALIRQSTQAA